MCFFVKRTLFEWKKWQDYLIHFGPITRLFKGTNSIHFFNFFSHPSSHPSVHFFIFSNWIGFFKLNFYSTFDINLRNIMLKLNLITQIFEYSKTRKVGLSTIASLTIHFNLVRLCFWFSSILIIRTKHYLN
jgi:hypothetical protein